MSKLTLLQILEQKNLKNVETLIRMGKVKVNGEIIFIPSTKISFEKDKVEVFEEKKEWVSRGAYKLLEAIKLFNLNFQDKTVLDIGSSTGGFTEVSLKYGAKKVYALDSGTNQLDYSLRTNTKVIPLEKTNLKSISFELFKEKMDIIVCDVSFISLKEVFKVIKEIVTLNTDIMLLIKPQFEASSKYVEKGGYVDEKHHQFLINRVVEHGKDNGFKLIKISKSPILGNKSKNIEYVTLFKRSEYE
ncbi:TlyA family RNA methyltransferase [Mycoplasma sp. 1012]